MGSGVTIQVQGLDKLRQKFKAIPQHITQEVDAELGAIAKGFENGAAAAAPRDIGRLAGGISSYRVSPMNWEVVSKESYSPYVEFGTRSRVSVPSELQSYAAQFRRTSSGDAKKMIFDWCKRKGIPEEAWFPIFIKIMTVGVNPHPFFFPQLPIARAELNKNLKQVVARALK